jgi:hypothetical protein
MSLDSAESHSRCRMQMFLGEAERDSMVDLARSGHRGRSSRRLKSRLAGLLIAVALRLEPAFWPQYAHSEHR